MLEQKIMQILEKVYQENGFDFRQYKKSSLSRRIERRIRTTRVDSYQQYIELLDSDPGEYKKLIDSLTIKVTDFFRDPEAWQILSQKVMPEIIKEKIENTRLPKRSGGQGKENGGTKPLFRIWSAGCATGEEALKKAKEKFPHLIILDIMLPKMDGFQVYRRLKADPQTREIRTIVLTAKGEEKDKRLGKDLGVDAYITKPFNIDTLLLEVKKILNQT